MIEGKGLISIWFFIGTLLFVYGILIFGAGVYGLFVPPDPPVVLQNLHAGVWWGAFLLALGGFYAIHFRPGKK